MPDIPDMPDMPLDVPVPELPLELVLAFLFALAQPATRVAASTTATDRAIGIARRRLCMNRIRTDPPFDPVGDE
jgi:hypothetical protein